MNGMIILAAFFGFLIFGLLIGYGWGREDIKEAWHREMMMTKMITLPFKRLDDRAVIPQYAHEGDSGMDIYALEGAEIPPYHSAKMCTGIACDIPSGYELQIRPRSGLAAKKGVVAAFGTVDMGYRGEIGVTLFNHSDMHISIAAGDRIAQIVLAPVIRANPIEMHGSLSKTERGEGGFGSTGA